MTNVYTCLYSRYCTNAFIHHLQSNRHEIQISSPAHTVMQLVSISSSNDITSQCFVFHCSGRGSENILQLSFFKGHVLTGNTDAMSSTYLPPPSSPHLFLFLQLSAAQRSRNCVRFSLIPAPFLPPDQVST